MTPLRLKAIILAALMATAVATTGCNVLGFLAAKTAQLTTPEDEIVAQFDISGKSVLVLVDIQDPSLASQYPHLQTALEGAINKVLIEHKACPQIVMARHIETARKTEPQFGTWSVTQIGKYFNVDMVLYVEIFNFRLKDEPTSNVYHGYAEGTVRLVSPEAGEQVWPVLSSARLLSCETMPGLEPETIGEQEGILIDGFGEKIARLFFTYSRDEIPVHLKVR